MKVDLTVEIHVNGNYCGIEPWCQFCYSEEIHRCYLFDKVLKLAEWDKETHQRHCIRCDECLKEVL